VDDPVSQLTPDSALTASPQRADEIFLDGPRSRFDELFTLFRVMWDFLHEFRTLHLWDRA
jgi:hypothetical protein